MVTKLTALSVVLLAIFIPSKASSEVCVMQTSSTNPAAKMLERQLSALRSIQRSRGCKAGDSTGGFFNACREVSLKIDEVQQELRSTVNLNGSCRANIIPRTTRTSKPKAVQVPVSAKTQVQSSSEIPKKMRRTSGALQYCVRLSDGYYFPTPNSQFSQKGGTDIALIQCKMICNDDDMAIYVNEKDAETAEMVSVKTGETYADLPTAYDYHGEGDFKRCDWNGYVKKVSVLLSAPRQLKRRGVGGKPDSKVFQKSEREATTPHQHRAPSYLVRVVGPAFIPDTENAAFGLMGNHLN